MLNHTNHKVKPASLLTALLLLFLLLANVSGGSTAMRHKVALPNQDTAKLNFPVPKNVENQLFYLQRDPNTNTIVCTLNMKDGQVDKKEPVHVFWLRYTEQGQQEELSYIQRTFAYGIKARPVENNEYELHFVSYKKLPLRLVKSDRDNSYAVYVTVNQKKLVLKRIYIHIEGGTFWSPNVKYIQLEGLNSATGKNTVERILV